MKRGSLFFIGLISAIITITGLSFAFGKTWRYNRYLYYCNQHRYNEKYNRGHQQNQNLNNDSTHSN